VRTILDQGPLVPGLLRQLDPAAGISESYLDHLRTAAVKKPAAGAKTFQVLVEPLSEREIEILDLIALGLSNQQIATRLVLSLATVKWHASNIYGKLGVSNRNRAVAKARALELIA
jgi:LuxR family maltose regulon positive regulatory protein